MIIRPAKLTDIPALVIIEKHAFSSPWTSEHFLYEIEQNPFSFLFVAEVDSIIVGYIDWWLTFQQGQINNVAVIPQLRRKKIGETLLLDALKRLSEGGAETVTLEVRVSNLPAQKLYEKFGFKNILRKPKYYTDGEDAFLMERYLPYA
jgi:[ribosomal protein S18]-alanine N-acetyltransferase